MPALADALATAPERVRLDSRAAVDPLDLRNLQRRLADWLQGSENLPELVGGFVRLVAQLTQAQQVAYWRSPLGEVAAPSARVSHPACSPAQAAADVVALAQLAAVAAGRGTAEVAPLDPAGARVAVAVPVLVDGQAVDACGVVLGLAPGQAVEPFVIILELAVGHVALWHLQAACRERGWEALAAAAGLELIEQVAAATDRARAARILVESLHRSLASPLVALGQVGRGGRCRLLAVSGQAMLERRSPRVLTLEALLAEVLARGPEAVEPAANPAARELAVEVGASAILAQRLTNAAGRAVAVLLVFEAGPQVPPQHPRILASLAGPLGECWGTLGRAEVFHWLTLPAAVRRVSRRRWALCAALGVAVALALAWPVPARITGPCRVEPVERRYVAAPFAALLAETCVETGDVVQAGQTLARLDGREMRLEQAALEAERARAQKERDVRLAAHETAAAELARLEIEKLTLRLELLAQQLAHLEIKAPLAGVVLSGQWDQARGAPVELGQALYEIAPLERVRVEIGVPADQWGEVAPGSPARVQLEATGREVHAAQLTRLHPTAESWDGQNVLVAELELANPELRLRPGMQGTAQVSGPRGARIANWLGRPWQRLTAWWGLYE